MSGAIDARASRSFTVLVAEVEDRVERKAHATR